MQLTLPAITPGRLARLLALGLILAGGCYLAITVVRLALVYREMVAAERQLTSAEALLRYDGLESSPAALARVEVEATAAGQRFRQAEAFLGGEPLLRLAAEMPWAGEPLATALDLAAIGYEASRIELAAASALRTFEAVSSDEDGTLGERVIDFTDAVEPQTKDIEARLTAIEERRERIGGRRSAPPLTEALNRMDERLLPLEDSFEKFESARAAAPALLGSERPMTYLVLGLDNTELMPAGGIVGVYGLVTFREGRLVERSFHEVDGLLARWREVSGGEYIEPPGPLKRYLLRDWSWSFALAGWSPDFPTFARQALFFYERSGAPLLDGVIGMDFAALEGLLGVLGPRDVEGYGVRIDAASVTEETLLRAREGGQPHEESHAFARAVAASVLDGVFGSEPSRSVDLLEALDGQAKGKHLFLYAKEPRLQRAVRDLRWAGEVKRPADDYLMVVNASVHSTKLNLVLEESIHLDVELDGSGNAHHALDLRYRNGLPEWALGRDPAAVERLMAQGFYGDYLRVFAPPAAQLADLRLNGSSVGAEEIVREEGKASFGRYLPLPSGARATLRFVYDVPRAAGLSADRGEYRLLIQKQPGAAAIPVTITVRLPEGARLDSLSLDGSRLGGEPPVINTDLSQDRELVLRYRR